MYSKSVDWFLYKRNTGTQWVKSFKNLNVSELVRFRFSENAKWFFFSFLWSDSYKIYYSFNFSWNEFTSPWQLLLVKLNNTVASIYCGSSSVSINSLSDFLIFVCLIWICVFYFNTSKLFNSSKVGFRVFHSYTLWKRQKTSMPKCDFN